ncbi:MAG: hypothetical protein LKJ88_07935 [Bacilli bacterium]|jgi:hypothetical protein|nr:hypothetical protein [Bacilli bacterium]
MVTQEDKLRVLCKIAKVFNDKGIVWAVGASLLLFFLKRTDDFHDIDIMIAEDDIEKTKSAMNDLGQLQPPNRVNRYRTKCFLEYKIGEVDIDLMAGFVIVKDGNEYQCEFDKTHIGSIIQCQGESIPLQRLEDWHRYYELMDRPQKAEMSK